MALSRWREYSLLVLLVAMAVNRHGLTGMIDWVQSSSAKGPITTPSMIRSAGYTAETHKVTTEDGYILTLHRIVDPKRGGPSGPVVFMQHGLEDSSSCWVLLGCTSPAFNLADNGYDVWMGNFRGNVYSREHTFLDPEGPTPEGDYWQFSWDEMAKFDLPAQLNFVLGKTKKEKMYYVGHSMGTTTFLTMNSLDRSWAEKVQLAIHLAPVAYVHNMKSNLKLFAPYCDAIQRMARTAGFSDLKLSQWTQESISAAMSESMVLYIFRAFYYKIVGSRWEQLSDEMAMAMSAQYPAGTSIYTVLQYAQAYNKQRFGGMDWGSPEENLAHHGLETPPIYILANVTTKIALFWGDGDWLAVEEDVNVIRNQVQNLEEFYRIPFDGWNHVDHLYAKDIDKYQSQRLLDLLKKHPID